MNLYTRTHIIVTILCSITHSVFTLIGVPRSELFPFGDYYGRIEGSFSLNLHFPIGFPFLNETFHDINVSKSGIIKFNNSVKAISPYHAEIDRGKGQGEVHATLWTHPFLSQKTKKEIQKKFVGIHLSIKSIIVITWENLTPLFLNCPNSPENTFQTMLVTDGVKSFVIFFYHKLEWSDFCANIVQEAYAYFMKGYERRLSLPGSGTPEILNLANSSNIGEAGKWVFQVDTEIVPNPEEPFEPITPIPVQITTTTAASRGITTSSKKFNFNVALYLCNSICLMCWFIQKLF